MVVFKCKMCGGDIRFEDGATTCVCEYCGTRQTLPRIDDDRRANMYDRANHYRRNNDFDKAAGMYERILDEDSTDAEAYWSLVLCKYGIEYVEDPATHRRVPTVNRTQFTSVFDDENYKSAIQNADISQRAIYEEEASAINEIQKGILDISQKEEPFDVFICYKETDENGHRTQDSVLANDLYYQLTEEGFKVFFSRITLEDKLGTAYEPYIFAALNSAKVMVVIGTRPEYLNAVWVKNEWSRYLTLVKQSGGKKVLIPAYRDMDPYDLPEEFSHLQAQDMSKLGFMQDLIRGITKIIDADGPKKTIKEIVVPENGVNVASLIKRIYIFLEDGNWNDADAYCERVLDQDPENAQAYLGKLMAELHVRHQEDLADCEQPFNNSNNYLKAVRFGDDEIVGMLSGFIDHINERNQNARLEFVYNNSVEEMNSAINESAFKEVARHFKTISGFKDADALAEQCYEKAENCRRDEIYDYAKSKMTGVKISNYEAAIKAFSKIPSWKDADEQIHTCQGIIEEIKKAEEEERLEHERQVEEAKKRAFAIAHALMKGNGTKLGSTIEESLTDGKRRVEHLESILNVFDSTQTQIQSLKNELNGMISQEKQLSGQRSQLGVFAFKEKKAIDEELAAASKKKNDLTNHLDRLQLSIDRYDSAADVESDLKEVKKSVADLETKIDNMNKNDYYQYSFEEALNVYLNEPDVASDVNSIYPAACFTLLIQGKADSVKFGRYVQRVDSSPEPIEWLVLARKGDRALIISKYALDCQQYNTSKSSVTWETCSLRKWLNSTFINNAFCPEEKNCIIKTNVTADKNLPTEVNITDKVFLLSLKEVNKYFGSDAASKCQGTAYCYAQGAYKAGNGFSWWWLRSSGMLSKNAALVYDSGSVNHIGNDVSVRGAVRPALWINLAL